MKTRPMKTTRSLVELLESRQLLTVFNPADAAAFKTALTNAQLGDTIVLQAGTTYTGEFTLKAKSGSSGYITIQSSSLASLPAAGVRVSPADSVNMPKLQSGGSNVPVVDTNGNVANNYKFVGVEFVGPANNSDLVTLVEIGSTYQAQQSTVAQEPHDIVIDRCYFRPNVESAQIRRAIGLHATVVDITNSYIENIHEGSDSNAIAGWNGTGPYNIINNHLEGAGENILFGGATNYMPTVATNVVVRGNHFIKPLYWKDGSHGFTATVKNLFELKQGSHFTIEDNIFENNWNSGQTGVAILFKLGDYDASVNNGVHTNVTEDIIFRNNIVRHATGALTFQGRDYAASTPDPGGLVRNFTITNNLFEDINTSGSWGANVPNIYLTQGPKNVTIDHNTFLNAYTTVETDSSNSTYPATNFRFTNNIANHSLYGFRSTSGTGDPTFSLYYNDDPTNAPGRITKNALVAGPNGYKYTTRLTYFPANQAAVGFTDPANHNYTLLPSSPYHNAGTDGKDLGADTSLLPAEFATVSSGTLNVNYGAFAGDAPRPVNVTVTSTGVTATYDGESINFTGIAGIAANGTGVAAAPLTINVNSGSIAAASDLGASSRDVTATVAAGATMTFNASQHIKSLDVSGTATLSAGGSKVLIVKSLSAAGRLNLTDNDLVLDYSGASTLGNWNGSSYTGVLGLLQAGRHDGDYAGNGIVTNQLNAMAPNTLTTLAAAEASDVLGITGGQTALFDGQAVDATSVIVKYTYTGDANLDGQITGDDYFLIDSAFPANATGWINGDFNFDGVINGDDYFLIDSNFPAQGAAL